MTWPHHFRTIRHTLKRGCWMSNADSSIRTQLLLALLNTP
jgi:hypothetical protein